MKRYIALTVALMTTTIAGLAQPFVGSITIAGTVANVTTITVASVAGYDLLPIAAGCVDQVVANATEKSNNKLGYTVTLNSLNAGSTIQASLNGAVGNTDKVNYTMKYGVTAVSLVNGSAVVTSSAARTPQAGVVKALSVTITSGAWVNTDTYSDTLTLTIASL